MVAGDTVAMVITAAMAITVAIPPEAKLSTEQVLLAVHPSMAAAEAVTANLNSRIEKRASIATGCPPSFL